MQRHRKRFPCCAEKMTRKKLTENPKVKANHVWASEETNTFPLIIPNFQRSGDIFVISWKHMSMQSLSKRSSLLREKSWLKETRPNFRQTEILASDGHAARMHAGHHISPRVGRSRKRIKHRTEKHVSFSFLTLSVSALLIERHERG